MNTELIVIASFCFLTMALVVVGVSLFCLSILKIQMGVSNKPIEDNEPLFQPIDKADPEDLNTFMKTYTKDDRFSEPVTMSFAREITPTEEPHEFETDQSEIAVV